MVFQGECVWVGASWQLNFIDFPEEENASRKHREKGKDKQIEIECTFLTRTGRKQGVIPIITFQLYTIFGSLQVLYKFP